MQRIGCYVAQSEGSFQEISSNLRDIYHNLFITTCRDKISGRRSHTFKTRGKPTPIHLRERIPHQPRKKINNNTPRKRSPNSKQNLNTKITKLRLGNSNSLCIIIFIISALLRYLNFRLCVNIFIISALLRYINFKFT